MTRNIKFQYWSACNIEIKGLKHKHLTECSCCYIFSESDLFNFEYRYMMILFDLNRAIFVSVRLATVLCVSVASDEATFFTSLLWHVIALIGHLGIIYQCDYLCGIRCRFSWEICSRETCSSYTASSCKEVSCISGKGLQLRLGLGILSVFIEKEKDMRRKIEVLVYIDVLIDTVGIGRIEIVDASFIGWVCQSRYDWLHRIHSCCIDFVWVCFSSCCQASSHHFIDKVFDFEWRFIFLDLNGMILGLYISLPLWCTLLRLCLLFMGPHMLNFEYRSESVWTPTLADDPILVICLVLFFGHLLFEILSRFWW